MHSFVSVNTLIFLLIGPPSFHSISPTLSWRGEEISFSLFNFSSSQAWSALLYDSKINVSFCNYKNGFCSSFTAWVKELKIQKQCSHDYTRQISMGVQQGRVPYYEHTVFLASFLFVLEFLFAFVFFVLLAYKTFSFFLQTFHHIRCSNHQRITLKIFNHSDL